MSFSGSECPSGSYSRIERREDMDPDLLTAIQRPYVTPVAKARAEMQNQNVVNNWRHTQTSYEAKRRFRHLCLP